MCRLLETPERLCVGNVSCFCLVSKSTNLFTNLSAFFPYLLLILNYTVVLAGSNRNTLLQCMVMCCWLVLTERRLIHVLFLYKKFESSSERREFLILSMVVTKVVQQPECASLHTNMNTTYFLFLIKLCVSSRVLTILHTLLMSIPSCNRSCSTT